MPKPTLGQGQAYPLPPEDIRRLDPMLWNYLHMLHSHVFGRPGGDGDLDHENVVGFNRITNNLSDVTDAREARQNLEVTHTNLEDVTANQHHNQVHDLWSNDHDDVNAADTPAVGDVPMWDGTQWQAEPGAAVALADGDKGDITVSGSGTVWTIDSDVVTYAKMQNVSAASKLLGRGSAAGAGNVEEISLGTGLTMSGTTLSASAGASAPVDPLQASFESEEFLGNDGTTGSIGKLGWGFVNSTVAFIASEANHVGIISKLQNNNSGSLYLGFTTGIFMLLPSMMFDNYFIIRPQSFDGSCSLWVGYQDTNSGTGEANNMILFEAISTDTNWFAVTNDGGTPTRHDMTIACTSGNWYTMRIRRIDGTHIGFTIVSVNGVASGVAEHSETATIPTALMGWAMRLRSHTAANRTIEMDYWHQLITLTR